MVLVMFVGGILGYMIGKPAGAIAAHKGEIVCVQLAFKNERWECGEL